jgi:hypothetical protein
MTRWKSYLIEKEKISPDKDEKEKEKESQDDSDIPRNEKGEPDYTGTGIKSEEGWKTPEQREQDNAQSEVDTEAQRKSQEDKIYNDEMERLEDRDKKIHSKLGRLLATPEEIEELDKERDEKEAHERELQKAEKSNENDEEIDENRFDGFLKKKVSESSNSNRKKTIEQLRSQGWEYTQSHGVWVKGKKKGKIDPTTGTFAEIDGKETSSEESDPKKPQLQPQPKVIDELPIKEKARKDFEKEKEKKKREREREKKLSLNKKEKEENPKKDRRKIYPSGAKAEKSVVDAINGKSKANKILLELTQTWQKKGIIPKGATAEATGSSVKYDLSKDWEGGSKIPKTDILIKDKNGKVINRVSVKNGSSQLMSGMKGESRSVLKTAAKESHLEEDPGFQDLIDNVNNFIQRKSFGGLDFGKVHTPEAEKIRSFHKNASKALVEYVNSNPKFLKSIIKEAMTGNNKFGKKSEATADTLLYLDPKGDINKCCMVKITDSLITKIAKESSLNFSIKSVGKKSSSAMRIQTPELNAGVSLHKIGSYLTEEIEEMSNKNNFFDMFDIEITPDLPDNDELAKIVKEEEEKNQKPNKKLQEHFETYELVEDD